jgi:hypothetical protein
VHHDFRAILIDTDIRAAFTHIAVRFALIDSIIRLRFDEITLRGSRRFQKMWAKSFPLENLSARRWLAHFDGSTGQRKSIISDFFSFVLRLL